MSDKRDSSEPKLPVHGFVLAGGRSSRMGRDKALLGFRGRPMVEIAVEKLRGFCSTVSIAGNRDDLSEFAPVMREARLDCGPVAGIEAGLRACTQEWALFIPVDVPLLPAALLRRWTGEVLARTDAGCGASSLLARRERQPAFCMIRRDAAQIVTAAVEAGERRVWDLLQQVDNDASVGWLWPKDASAFAPGATDLQMEFWFRNVNTPDELQEAEMPY